MESIKTSKEVTHYCRLHSNGAIACRCKIQCDNCKEATPDELLKQNFFVNNLKS